MRIELNYLAMYQHENGVQDHILCSSYMFKKDSVLLNYCDSFGNIRTAEVKFENIKELTIKPIGENRIVYSYKREE